MVSTLNVHLYADLDIIYTSHSVMQLLVVMQWNFWQLDSR